MFSTLVEINIDSSKFKSDFEKEIKEILHNIKKEETPKKKNVYVSSLFFILN